jgi:hypothetical protein
MSGFLPPTPDGGLSYTEINTAGVVNAALNSEATFKTFLSSLGDNPSTKDMLYVQELSQQYAMMMQMASAVIKQIGDVAKEVAQKMG